MIHSLIVLGIVARGVSQVPDVPRNWVAQEKLTLVAQGQRKSQTVTHYYDLDHNRTRVEDDQGSITVSFYYPEYKQMEVDKDTMQCIKYCSLCEQGICDDLPPLIDANASDAGPLEIFGKQVQIAQVRQKIFGVLTLELDSIYVDMTNVSKPTPVAEQDVINPPFFPSGMQVYADTTWTDFQEQSFAKDEGKFAVKGVDTCKKASFLECNGVAHQLRRVRDKAYHSFAHFSRTPVSPSSSHYEDPKEGCQADEVDIKIQGVAGDACAPSCSLFKHCPTDVPAGATAKPQCVLQDSATHKKYCALVCTPSTNSTNDDQCGANASCKNVQGSIGLCTYDDNRMSARTLVVAMTSGDKIVV